MAALDWAGFLAAQRWFAGKARSVREAAPCDRIALPGGTLYVVRVAFADAPRGALERYVVTLPLTERTWDALDDPIFCRALLDAVRQGGELSGEHGRLVGRPSQALPAAAIPAGVTIRRVAGEQSNSSIVFADALIMKVFRRLADGINPDLEITRFLTEQTTFRGTPRLAGALEYHAGDGAVATLAVVEEYIASARDGWGWMLDRLAAGEASIDALQRLGARTAELHRALATPTGDPAFAAEPITPADVTAWATGVDRQIAAAREAARGRALPEVPDVAGAGGLGGLVGCAKIRHHGDFHLGQTLAIADGQDFAIIDFEGEPLRPLDERRRKHTPLRDVAGMLRSIGYAAASATLSPAARERWETDARAAYLAAYRAHTGGAPFVPQSDEAFARAVAVFEVEKAAYEIVYEANNRPNWIDIPLAGFVRATTSIDHSAGAA
jgi:maltose alpha-D-glucosyltransferase/alpha-amylase